MTLARFEPLSLAGLWHRDFDRFAARRLANGCSENANWSPAVDIIEEKERFVLRADLPGVNAEDIDINMEKGVLSLSGERTTETRDEEDGVRRFERVSGKFYRRFTLPESADADAITAKSANGILEVVIPKQPQVQARRIEVQAA